MALSKTIRLQLFNGSLEGVIEAKITNWSGRVVKVPRESVISGEESDKANNPGAYVLLYPRDGDRGSVYIGESGKVFDRLRQHLYDAKSEAAGPWVSAICLMGSDLGKDEICYLEKRLFELANENRRYEVLTKLTHKEICLSDADRDSTEAYLDNARPLLEVLGCNMLVPMPKPKAETPIFICRGNGAEASGFVSPPSFTVLEGSVVSDHTTDSLVRYAPRWCDLRDELEKNGTIVDRRFTRDYEFDSRSAASSIVLGRKSNGNVDWKLDGKALGEFGI